MVSRVSSGITCSMPSPLQPAAPTEMRAAYASWALTAAAPSWLYEKTYPPV